jgi:hypothetical protein
MATQTTTGGGNYGRKFTISRKNGQNDKNGKPYFFEWLRELPDNQEGRIFEMRPSADGTPRYYELFQAIDGILTTVERKPREILGKARTMLCLTLRDGIDVYEIEVGDIDGRYSLDVMKRLLHPDFDQSQKLRLSPYSLAKDTGGYNIGVSAFSGVNKLSASWKEAHLEGMPEAEKEVLRNGETNYYFDAQAEWLFERLKARVFDSPAPPATQPVSNTDPIKPNVKANQEAPFDDLPF